ERLEIYKHTLPNHGGNARPVDLFEREIPRIWHLRFGGEGENRHDIVGLFNWNAPAKPTESAAAGMEEPTAKPASERSDASAGKSETFKIDPVALGLPAQQKYVGFDYWQNEFIAPFDGAKEFDVPAGACRIIALRP